MTDTAELIVIEKSVADDQLSAGLTSSLTQRYLSDTAKPVFSAGGTSISIAQAKLFGLVDKEGNIATSKLKCDTINDVREKVESKLKSRVFEMSNASKPKIEAEEVGNNRSFTRTREALSAMKNPECGYDFVERLQEKGNFLESLATQAASKKNKLKGGDQLKADYESKLDKLACPTCKTEQSFDEYIEKRRICARCQQRFRQLNVSNADNFLKRMNDNENAKLEKLAIIDREIYGNDGKPFIRKQTGSSNTKSKTGTEGVLGQILDENKKISNLAKELTEKSYKLNEVLFDSKIKQEQQLSKQSKKKM